MFPFNLLATKPNKSKNDSFFKSKSYKYTPQGPKEIREMIKTMTKCGNCHFVVFDNYWANEIEKKSIKLCPTCGYKL